MKESSLPIRIRTHPHTHASTFICSYLVGCYVQKVSGSEKREHPSTCAFRPRGQGGSNRQNLLMNPVLSLSGRGRELKKKLLLL